MNEDPLREEVVRPCHADVEHWFYSARRHGTQRRDFGSRTRREANDIRRRADLPRCHELSSASRVNWMVIRNAQFSPVWGFELQELGRSPRERISDRPRYDSASVEVVALH